MFRVRKARKYLCMVLGSSNKLSQTVGLQTTKIFLTVLGARYAKSGRQQDCAASSETLGRIFSCLFPASGGGQQFLAFLVCSWIVPVSASLDMWCFP